MTWHTKLKKLIKERGYSQKQFADRCGISEATVSKYLNGKRMPSLEVAHIMTQELGVSLDWLVDETSATEGNDFITDYCPYCGAKMEAEHAK